MSKIRGGLCFTLALSVIIMGCTFFGTGPSDWSEIYTGGVFTGDVYKERKRLLEKECHKIVQLDSMNTDRILVNEEHSLGYCSVPKAASTYWHSLFAILEGGQEDILPEEVAETLLENVQSKVKVKYLSRMMADTKLHFLESAKMFLFTRDPYQRLLSAYINKFLSPNSYYWSTFGKNIIKDYRNNVSNVSRVCGNDVTFEEFLQYVVDSKDVDPHWTTVNRLCSPCHLNYDFIGRLETMDADILELGKMYPILSKFADFNSQSDNHVRMYMSQKIAQFLYHYEHLKNCLSFEEMISRLWETFKVKGYIDRKETPPVISDHITNSTKPVQDILLDKAFSSYVTGRERQGILMNQEMYTKEKYKSVSSKTLQEIQTKFRNDFALFGYSSIPKHRLIKFQGIFLTFTSIVFICVAFFLLKMYNCLTPFIVRVSYNRSQ